MGRPLSAKRVPLVERAPLPSSGVWARLRLLSAFSALNGSSRGGGAEKETPVIAARGQLRAARGEGHRTDLPRVSLEGLEALAARHVPDDDGAERGRQ